MRMKKVTRDEPAAMDVDSDRCPAEPSEGGQTIWRCIRCGAEVAFQERRKYPTEPSN
jgi:hypothetical protein